MKDNSVDRDKDPYDSVYSVPKPLGDIIRMRDNRALRATHGELIRGDMLIVRYTACTACLVKFAENLLKQESNPNANKVETHMEGVCLDLDHVYLKWLQSGKEKIFRLSCPHKPEICQYLKGKAVVDLGMPSQRKSFDYDNVFLSMELGDSTKTNIIARYLS